MGMIDFKALKRELSTLAVLDLLGWNWTTSCNGERRGPCLLHGSTSRGSRSFAAARQGWFCHKCKRNGDALALWAAVKGLSVYAAAVDLCHALNVPVPYLPVNSEEERFKRQQRPIS